MSKRKQAAIEAAKQTKAAQQQQRQANTKGLAKTSLLQRLKSPAVLASIGIGLLLTLGVIGATIGNDKNNAWLDTFSAPSSGVQPTSANAPAVNPLPTASPTPQLAKEYIYAGSRMLAVEDANAPHSSYQPTDLVVWRIVGGAGNWYIKDSKSGDMSSGVFGASGDIPAPADFDGDGQYDFCVYRPNYPSNGLGTFFVQGNGSGAFQSIQFGLSSDLPVPADYDGDGRADVAIWRNSNATFYILNSTTNLLSQYQIGQAGGTDKPIVGDYDGDGKTDAALFRKTGTYATWIVRRSLTGQTSSIDYGYGAGGSTAADDPVQGDYDGDGAFDYALRRNSDNTWHYWRSSNGQMQSLTMPTGFQLQATDISVAGDYDGDGKTDPAVWRPSNGTWYIRRSSKEGQTDQLRQDQWGANGDTPIAAPFKR